MENCIIDSQQLSTSRLTRNDKQIIPQLRHCYIG